MASWVIPAAIIGVLIFLNGVFVAAEFAIVGAPRAAIDRRAAQGDRVARTVQRILHHPRRQDQYLATAQIGITIASLGLGMYGEHVVAEWIYLGLESLGPLGWAGAHALASILAVMVLTYFHIVLGEMVPKTLSLQRAEGTVLRVTPLMLWVQRLLYPLVLGLNGLGNGLLRLVGIDRQEGTHQQYHTAEELQYIIKESQEGGLIRAESGRVLRELFAFGDRTAGAVMVPRVRIVGVAVGTTPDQVRALLRAARHTRYPVYEGDLDHVVGVVHIKDLLALLREGRPLQAGDAHPVAYVPEAITLDAVLRTMRRAGTQMVIVMDEHGGTAGLVTVEDLFEEVVGEIEDGSSQPPIRRDPTGRLLVDGTVRLEEAGEHLQKVLDHEEVETVSGLVLTLLGRPPRVGDAVTYDGLRFEVIAVTGRGVRTCAIAPAPPTPGAPAHAVDPAERP